MKKAGKEVEGIKYKKRNETKSRKDGIHIKTGAMRGSGYLGRHGD